MMSVLLTFHPMKGAGTYWCKIFLQVFLCGLWFYLLTVAGRISGLLAILPSHKRHEHRHFDGHLRDFPARGMDRTETTPCRIMIGGVVCIARDRRRRLRRI